MGSKDKYYGHFCKEALGIGYLENNPDVQISIEVIGGNDTSGDLYGIHTIDLNLTTLENNINDFITITAANPADWETYGISVSSNTLTISNTYGTLTFYSEIVEPPTDSTTEPEPDPEPEPEPDYSGVRIITGTETLCGETIEGDVYITSTGIATFENVTVTGNVYCYGQLTISDCTIEGLCAYNYGGFMTCDAYDGTHGKVTGQGNSTITTMVINSSALDYAFQKWGKQ